MPNLYPDWMAGCAVKRINQEDSQLDNLPLCQIPMPGSHDAGSYGPEMSQNSRTQEYNIPDQLLHGVRYFDFRVKVDNGVFFSHHGPTDSRENIFAKAISKPADSWIFSEIAAFCRAHPGEIVIMNFTDFTAVPGQSFNDDDKQRFITSLTDLFGGRARDSLLIQTSTSNSVPTYKQCIGKGQRVMVIINDDAAVWRGRPKIWLAKNCWRDRFSAYNFHTARTWAKITDDTIADQQSYLASTDEKEGRDLNRFWVSQGILAYQNTTMPGGYSENRDGASEMNASFVSAYKHWWAHESATGTTQVVQTPNILLLDYSGVYEDFAGVCSTLLGVPIA